MTFYVVDDNGRIIKKCCNIKDIKYLNIIRPFSLKQLILRENGIKF